MNFENETALHKTARRRVARKLGFLVHLLVFVLVNAGLWLLNAANGGRCGRCRAGRWAWAFMAW